MVSFFRVWYNTLDPVPTLKGTFAGEHTGFRACDAAATGRAPRAKILGGKKIEFIRKFLLEGDSNQSDRWFPNWKRSGYGSDDRRYGHFV